MRPHLVSGNSATLPVLLLAYACGLACAPFLENSLLYMAAALLCAALWFFLRGGPFATPCLIAFFLFLGIAFYFQQVQPILQPAGINAFAREEPLIVQGQVCSISGRSEDRSEMELSTDQVTIDGATVAVHGRMLLVVDHGELAAREGDTVRFRTRLRLPRSLATPGEFDYPRHLASRGIAVTAFLPEARDLAVFPAPAGAFYFAKWQNATIRAIAAAVSPEIAPLVRALVTGDKGGITAGQRELLARGGLSHLFSISGLHLGLIAFFLFLLARTLYCRSETLLLLAPPQRALPWLLLPALWFYLQFTGNALPTRRAFLMALAGALLLLLCRRSAPMKILAAAALLILLASPLSFYQPSFQLSFAGIFGIFLLLPPWTERLGALPLPVRWIAAISLTTLAAFLATTPLALMHFHLFAPAGLLTNVIAVPAIGFLAVPLGFVGAITAPFFPEAGALFFRGCAAVIETVLALAERVVALPFLHGSHFYLSPWQLVAIFLLCSGLLLGGSSRRPRTAAALLLTGVVLLGLPASNLKGISVTVLSVGQGESILLSLPPDRHFLIDGGGVRGSAVDIGERLIAPALGRLGVHRLEAVILTHDHPDHRLGLLHVLRHFPVKAFWTASPAEVLDAELFRVLAEKGIPLQTFSPGWHPLPGIGAGALSLFVPRQYPESLNDSSLIIRAGLGADAVLLTGDIEKDGVAALLHSSPPPANLLKLPHHGSRNSSPAELLDLFQPKAVFASVGRGNVYHFPHPEVVAALDRRRIPLYRTDLDGTLRFFSEGQGWQVERWRNGLFR